jgi:RNA polymerase sigma factor (sigma-70 family)
MTVTDPPDDELAAACAARDQSADARRRADAAFRHLYDRHAKRLLAFLGGRVNRAAVDDIHQDVWAKVWQALPTGFHGGNFRAWLHQVARNVVIDHQRKRTVEPLADEAGVVDHRHRHDDDHDRHDALARCLERLASANAAAADLVRCRVGGESYDDYCQRTGMPADKAYRTFHQAKAQLQECVERGSP